MIKSEQTRICSECGKPLKKSLRSDAKFCDEECRNDYFNAIKASDHAEIRKIQNALKGNRRILKQLLGKNSEIIVEKAALDKAGYHFDYHTHHVISKRQGNEFIFSFNYGYRLMPDATYKIVKSFQ